MPMQSFKKIHKETLKLENENEALAAWADTRTI